MKTAQEITKTWKTQSGKTVTISGKLITAKDVRNEWGFIDELPTLDIAITIDVEGLGDFSTWIRELSKPQGDYTHYVSRSGHDGALGLTPAQVEIINNVKKELEQHPLWVERQARIEKDEAETEAYESRMREIFPEDYR